MALFVAVAAQAQQKNVKALTNVTDAQLGQIMDNIAASLGVHCDFCHARNEQKQLDFPSDAKQEKKTARAMILMVIDLNEKNFHGHPAVGCYTCHLGKERPSSMVALPVPVIPPSKPDTEGADRKTYPAAKDLIAKYVTAIGGEAAAKKLATGSMIGKATRITADGTSMPLEMYRSDGKRVTRITPPEGPQMAQMFGTDGGWTTGRPGQGILTLTAADAVPGLAFARAYDPVVSAPDTARVFGKDTIDGHETWTVGAQIDEHTRQRLWFDATTGLVLRRVITINTPVGQIPTQTDYDDYRDVAGVKVPFAVRVSTITGGSTRKYTSIELGVPVDEKVFAPPK
jgi:hypothetical protein